MQCRQRNYYRFSSTHFSLELAFFTLCYWRFYLWLLQSPLLLCPAPWRFYSIMQQWQCSVNLHYKCHCDREASSKAQHESTSGVQSVHVASIRLCEPIGLVLSSWYREASDPHAPIHRSYRLRTYTEWTTHLWNGHFTLHLFTLLVSLRQYFVQCTYLRKHCATMDT